DLNPDLVVANQFDQLVNGGTITVLHGDGKGSFPRQETFAVANGSFLPDVKAEDLDGDGHPELIVTDRNNASVYVLLNDGRGAFGPPQSFVVGSTPYSSTLAQVDGDGKLDIVV